jgi:hypothetical protein
VSRMRPLLLFVFVASGCAAQSRPLAWQPSWPGTEMAVVSGSTAGPGPWVFRFRMPAGYWIHPHTHPVDASITVISGTFLVGMGAVLDSTGARVLAPGERIVLTAGMQHFEGTRGPTDIEVSGTGAWGITFVDPAKDPSFAAMQSRGQAVMGVDQYASKHVFEDLPDGGRIVLDADSAVAADIAAIRAHMRDIQAAFRAGDFTKPFQVHDQTVPGTGVMAARRAAITYEVADRPRGGEVRIRTNDAAAITAIHEFLAFQRGAHHAAGHEQH